MELLLNHRFRPNTTESICSYDVNVTPDKRKVFLHHEAEVLQALQEVTMAHSLTQLFIHSLTHSLTCLSTHPSG